MKPVTDPDLIKRLNAAAAVEQAESTVPPVTIRRLPIKEKTEEPFKPPSREFSWGELIRNLPSSGAQWGRDMVGGLEQAVTSPIDTAAAMGKMTVGGVQSLIPGEQQWEQQYFDPIADFYSDRYGSWDQFKMTAMDDPVGTLSDIALVPTAAGVGLKATSLAAKGTGALTRSKTLAQAGEQIGKAGTAAIATGAMLDPLNVTYNAAVRPVARTAAKVLLDPSVPLDIYQRGAKWPIEAGRGPEVARELSETALTYGLRPTVKGSKKLDRVLNNVTDALNTKLDEAIKAGSMISRDALFKHFDELIAKYGSPTRLSGKKNRKIIQNIRDKYLQNFDEMTGGETLMSPKQVQDFKIDIYEDLRAMNAFGNPKKTSKAAKAGMKAAARAAKEELETIAPGVDELNQQFARLAQLRDAMPRPTRRLASNNFLGLGMTLKPAAGTAIGGQLAGEAGAKIGLGAGLLGAFAEVPSVKFATAEKLFAAINNPILDPRTKSKLLPALRQTLSELEQQAQANPELFAEE